MSISTWLRRRSGKALIQGNHGSAETLQGMSVCQVNGLSQCVLVRRRNMSRCLWVAAKELHSVLVVRRGDAQSVNQ